MKYKRFFEIRMCLKGITKFLIAFTNGFFLIIGLGLLVGGAIVYSNAAQYGVPIDVAIGILFFLFLEYLFFLYSFYYTFFLKKNTVGVIVTGGIVFLISFLGCYGAKWENRWMLYAVSLLLFISNFLLILFKFY